MSESNGIDYKAKCKVCGVGLSHDNCYFSNTKSSFMSRCKPCYSIHRKPITKRYIDNNPGKIRESNKKQSVLRREEKKIYAKAYHLKNREKAVEYSRQRYRTYDREEQLEKRRKWYQDNKERHAVNRASYERDNKDKLRAARRKWENERLLTDMNYKLQKSLAKRIRYELKGVGKKDKSTEDLLGCSIEYLKTFIEGQFLSGMSWNNWNTLGWHLDHRIPVSWFNLKNDNCRRLAFNYKNLQPLWSVDNLKKKNFYSHKMAS